MVVPPRRDRSDWGDGRRHPGRGREGAARVAAEIGCPAAGTLDELLGIEAELAVVLAPHVHHCEIALRCLRAGLPVLVEKPLAITAAEADLMVAEAEARGLVLAVALQQRTRPEVREARRLVASGTLGALRRADVLATWPRRSSYFRTAPWRGTWTGEGGGILVNQGQHDLDLLCHLVGSPGTVTARVSHATHGLEVEDTAAALLSWANGALGTFRVSTAELDEPQRVELTFTRGRLRLRPGSLEVWTSEVDFPVYAAAEGDPYAVPTSTERPVELELDPDGGTHVALYRDLVRALAGDVPPVAPAREALAAVELANAAVMSAELERTVELPLDRSAYATLLQRLRGAHLVDRRAPVAHNGSAPQAVPETTRKENDQ